MDDKTQVKTEVKTRVDSQFPLLTYLTPFYQHDSKTPQSAIDWLDKKQRETIKKQKNILIQPRVSLSIPSDVPYNRIIDLSRHPRYKRIWQHSPTQTHLKQKGEGWLQRRKKRISGSKLGTILGFHGLERLLQAFTDTYLPEGQVVPSSPLDEQISQENMDYGNYFEISAVATFVHTYAEAYDLEAHEALQHKVIFPPHLMSLLRQSVEETHKRSWTTEEEALWLDFFLDSPDLVGIYRKDGHKWVLEIKTKRKPQTRIPETPEKINYYYIPQLLAHSLAVGTEGTLFLGWGPEEADFQYVPQNFTFWELAIPNLVWFHVCGMNKQVPTQLYNETLTKKLKDMCMDMSNVAYQRKLARTRSVYSKWTDSELDQVQLMCRWVDEEQKEEKDQKEKNENKKSQTIPPEDIFKYIETNIIPQESKLDSSSWLYGLWRQWECKTLLWIDQPTGERVDQTLDQRAEEMFMRKWTLVLNDRRLDVWFGLVCNMIPEK
jgi:hypothetical protein